MMTEKDVQLKAIFKLEAKSCSKEKNNCSNPHNQIRVKDHHPSNVSQVLATSSFIGPHLPERITTEANPPPEGKNSTNSFYYPTYYSYISIY